MRTMQIELPSTRNINIDNGRKKREYVNKNNRKSMETWSRVNINDCPNKNIITLTPFSVQASHRGRILFGSQSP